MDYVLVKKGDRYECVDYMMQPISPNNYSAIHTFAFRLIKVRYTEIILYFSWILIVFIETCNKKSQFDGNLQTFNTYSANSFTECAFYAHESLKMSVYMLKSMLIAMQKMKIAARYRRDREIEWPLHTIIESIITFVEDYELNNYTIADFSMVIASRYLINLENCLHQDVINKIQVIVEANRQYYRTTHTIVESAYWEEKISKLTPEEPNVFYKKLYKVIDNFYGDVITNDFKGLGFHQAII